jgi:hypothetical protein
VALCVARVPMFRQKELMDQPIRLKQAVAVQAQFLGLFRQVAPLPHPVPCLGEAFAYVHAKLLREVTRADMTEFPLEDKLTDHALFIRGGQGAVDRQFIAFQAGNIRVEVMLVLKVCPAHMGKRCHSQPDQVRAGPELVTINESGLFRVFDSGVSAGNMVAIRFELGIGCCHPFPLGRPIGDR